jgi:outer membrane protein OmpA-like peptidoglycan-associated protein
VAGAGIGAAIGGWRGAAIGAGVGALAGGSVGYYLDMQARELEKVAETKRTEHGILVSLKSDILFDHDSAIVKPEAVSQLQKVGDILAKYKDDRIRIDGFTDSTGTASYNEQLSLRRAAAVKSVLLSRGVEESQMYAQGLGETRPVAANTSNIGRSKNRRVELHIDVPEPS